MDERQARCGHYQRTDELCDAHDAGNTGPDCGWLGGSPTAGLIDECQVEIRTLVMYWTCAVCHEPKVPQMAVVRFDAQGNVTSFECLHHSARPVSA